ncbi:MAG: hypothetical protein ACR2NX_13995 [Chthoniobacterales bacterium]
MDDEIPDGETSELISRPPLEEDLAKLCRRLNELEARYLVVGGFAISQAGFARPTGDIDLIIDTNLENEARVYKALEDLPDKAVLQLDPGDVAKYIVVRVGDEVLVDLMRSASGIDYAEASQHIVTEEVEGVPIPFASPQLLWRMKRHTHREKDAADLVFLRELFAKHGVTPPE